MCEKVDPRRRPRKHSWGLPERASHVVTEHRHERHALQVKAMAGSGRQ